MLRLLSDFIYWKILASLYRMLTRFVHILKTLYPKNLMIGTVTPLYSGRSRNSPMRNIFKVAGTRFLKIEKMDKAKNYLKQLVKENMYVGVEIALEG